MNQTFKKPAKWIEHTMLIVLPSICLAALIFLSVYYHVSAYHPGNFNKYEVVQAIDKN